MYPCAGHAVGDADVETPPGVRLMYSVDAAFAWPTHSVDMPHIEPVHIVSCTLEGRNHQIKNGSVQPLPQEWSIQCVMYTV